MFRYVGLKTSEQSFPSMIRQICTDSRVPCRKVFDTNSAFIPWTRIQSCLVDWWEKCHSRISETSQKQAHPQQILNRRWRRHEELLKIKTLISVRSQSLCGLSHSNSLAYFAWWILAVHCQNMSTLYIFFSSFRAHPPLRF